jgi:hypothetical protein
MRVVLLLLVVAAFASAEKSLYEESAPSMEGTEENLLSVVKELRQATAGTQHEPAALRIEDHANLIQKAKAYKHSFGARNALRAAIRALVSELNSGHNHDRNALNNERNAGHNAIRNASNRGKGVTRKYREKACPTKKAMVEAEAARNSAKNALNSIKRRKVCNLNTSWFDMNIKGAAPKFGGELRNKWDKARADYLRKLSKYNAAVRAYNKAAREHAGAMSAFKATVKAEASNAHAACRNAHKAYELLKKDVASNVRTRKQVYIASKVITCYIDNLKNNGGAKNCADRARRANTSRWNISAPKMNACLSKVALQAQLGPLSWRPSKRNCHANHWNERGIKERSTKERQSKERNSKERATKKANERKKKNNWKTRSCSGMSLRGNGIYYKGYTYRVSGGQSPNDNRIGCDNSWKALPSGYHVAPQSIDSQMMAKCYKWGTHILVSSTGIAWGSKGYANGRVVSNGALRKSGNRVKVAACNYRVLLRRHGSHNVAAAYSGGGNGIHYAGYFWRTLDGVSPHDRSIRCENHWKNIPYGCSVATNCGWIQHMARSYWWGTHVLQGKTCSYGTRTYTNGRHFSGGCGISGNRAKASGCSLRVILQCKTRL